MGTIRTAFWIDSVSGSPLTAPTSTPTFRVVDDTGAITVAVTNCTLVGNTWRSDSFAAVAGRVYTIEYDGDPNSDNNVTVGDRHKSAQIDGDLEAGLVLVLGNLANLDVAVSTRSTLTQAQILSDATPFPGANVDALISSRATQAQILSDATPFPGANVDALISSRAAPGDAMALTPAERTAIDVELTAAHGAGAWTTGAGGAVDWTAAEREQIRDSLGVDGTKTAATGGQMQDVVSDVAELNDTKITAGRAANLDEITAARLAELNDTKITAGRAANLDEITAARLAELDAANLPADVALVLSTGGPGPWTTGAGASPAVVAAAVWATAVPGAFLPGSAGVVLAGIVSAIQGADSRDLSELAGAGWLAGTDTLEEIRNAIDGLVVPPIVGHAVNPTVIP